MLPHPRSMTSTAPARRWRRPPFASPAKGWSSFPPFKQKPPDRHLTTEAAGGGRRGQGKQDRGSVRKEDTRLDRKGSASLCEGGAGLRLLRRDPAFHDVLRAGEHHPHRDLPVGLHGEAGR